MVLKYHEKMFTWNVIPYPVFTGARMLASFTPKINLVPSSRRLFNLKYTFVMVNVMDWCSSESAELFTFLSKQWTITLVCSVCMLCLYGQWEDSCLHWWYTYFSSAETLHKKALQMNIVMWLGFLFSLQRSLPHNYIDVYTFWVHILPGQRKQQQ